MLTRIVSALVALPLFFLAVYFTPAWVLPLALSLLTGLAAYELLHNTGIVKCPVLLTASVILSVAAVLLDTWLSLPLILCRMNTGIRVPKWLGYGLYPLHLILLILLKLMNGYPFETLIRGF